MRQQRELTQLQPQQHWRIFSLQKALLSPHNHYQDFAESSVGNESACNAGDPGSISGSGRSAGEGIGYPLQYSGLENSMDCIARGVTKSWIRMSNFHFTVGALAVAPWPLPSTFHNSGDLTGSTSFTLQAPLSKE